MSYSSNAFISAILLFFLLSLFTLKVTAQNEGDFRTKKSGDWKNKTTWQVFQNGNWKNASSAPKHDPAQP